MIFLYLNTKVVLKQLQFLLLILIANCFGCSEPPKPASAEAYRDLMKAITLWEEEKNDSALYYFNQVTNSSKDSLQIATAYYYMGVMQLNAGDYFGSQETILKSLKYLDARNKQHHIYLSSDYNELGISSSNLKNYPEAIRYYDQALRFAQNSSYRITYLNNKAVAYEKMKKYDQAIAIYLSIIDSSKNDMREYAMTLSNLAKARWLRDSSYPALPEFWEALQIRKDSNDKWGLNASYAHLSDYYASSLTDSALIYAKKMYAVAQQLNSPDDKLEALEKLGKLSSPNAAKQYFLIHNQLNESIQLARNAAKNQFALIRYDAEKSRAENIRLQKQNAEKELFLYGVIVISAVTVIIAIIWYRKRKQRLARESQNLIREHQLKTSQRVHDVVANGLYRVMTSIQYQDIIEKEPLLDKLEVLYEQSRDISYEQPKNNDGDFQDTVAELLTSFATSTTKVLVVGNYKDSWNGVSPQTKNNVEHVLQELMINMKKHSCAKHVVVKFARQGNLIKIQYTDDGIGIPSTLHFGNGLTNTENRIKGLGGRLIFDNAAERGLKIDVFFPIA